MLIKKLFVAILIAISIILIGNIAYAKEESLNKRIKEIKFEENIDISRLNRRGNEIYTRYSRQVKTTSRSGEARQEKQEKTEKKEKENNKDNKDNKEKKQYKTLKDVKISVGMNLSIRTGLSKKDFVKVIKNVKKDESKFFYENAELIYDLCEKYQINEIFFCGLIASESGWNIASNHRNTHNYISLMSNGKLIYYSSTKEGLEVAAKKLHADYLTPGGKFYHGKTLSGVKTNFCPASKTWVNLVYTNMSQIMTAVNKIK